MRIRDVNTRGDSTPVEGPTLDAGVAQLYAVEHTPMVRLATLMVGSVAAAEDIVHDAFAAVGQRWAEIERPGAYLRRAVVNGCGAALRRREVEERYRTAAPLAGDPEIPTRLVELSDALDRLTDRQRMVVVLRYFVDLPDDEIAELLDARPGTVRSLAFRALAVLREELT